MIYLDYAATSAVKPESVYTAADHALRYCSGNPGRSGHDLSLEAGSLIESARVALAGFLGAGDASQISFTNNATTALNMAIFGIVSPDTHIITSSLEHNSVSRPLEYLKSKGCQVTVLPADINHGVDPEDVRKAVSSATSLVVMTHISNVTGTVNDITSIGRFCREYDVPFLVDAAQSAGTRRIDVEESCIDMLAFPGHKGLLGPQGTGGLYVRKDLPLRLLLMGGTGSFSESLIQPYERPSAFESGTLNVPGIAGLAAGVKFIKDTGMQAIFEKESLLRSRIVNGLSSIDSIHLHTPSDGYDGGGVISFTMDDMDPSDISMILNNSFGIAVRAGLHCAPYAHTMLGTIESGGTVRVSPGFFSADEEIDLFISAMAEIAS